MFFSIKKNEWLLIFFMLAFSSCEEFLYQDPQEEISKEDALSDIDNVQLSLNGTYYLISSSNYWGEFYPIYAELAGGNAKPASNSDSYYEDIYNFNISSGESDNTYSYQDIYTVILAANNIIEAIPELTDGTEEEKNQIMGEALAIRAMAHFDLLRLYAHTYIYSDDASHLGIVLRDTYTPTDTESARSTVAEGYTLVVNDLVEAAGLLNDFSEALYFSKQAAQALLSRVYLYQGEWAKAASTATEIISSNVINLASYDEYLNIWENGYIGDEHLLRLDNSNITVTTLSTVWGINSTNENYLQASEDLISLFDSSDIRGYNSAIVLNDDNYYATLKYPSGNVENTANDISILRLSEVYLIRAEAYAELGRNVLAQNDLNVIRQRANPITTEITLTDQALIDEILLERRREFAFEGHLLFDLTRKKIDVLRNDCNSNIYNCNVAYPNNKFIMPIPEDAINTNSLLEQNEDY
ncbi:RagB/SusD family nutrient uptake outer membrane protein [Chondrinema litorale]|uniref:RagB/SusD family nutrient uptake outer membrane protein n=1 Tax=Chondrinema litorale TaxID=2994555 RepID=UPI002543E1C8|nr:RagB/SusD family nutrient uptake outer membrane protein [Chondrinema litorale]UZR97120.1 RagB/SusD family nutrient uptake outer membrane protein [Chondrinema litorale]